MQRLVDLVVMILMAVIRELKCLPPELHWFCSAYESNAPHFNFVKTEHAIGESVDLRREHACETLMLFSFDGEDAARYQEDLGRRLDQQLGRCDACVVGYYKYRQRMIERLRE